VGGALILVLNETQMGVAVVGGGQAVLGLVVKADGGRRTLGVAAVGIVGLGVVGVAIRDSIRLLGLL